MVGFDGWSGKYYLVRMGIWIPNTEICIIKVPI
jgi:hypothetical protein